MNPTRSTELTQSIRDALSRQGLYKLARTHIDNAARKLPQLRRAEIHPVCSFPHTTATHLVMAGVSLPEVQTCSVTPGPRPPCAIAR